MFLRRQGRKNKLAEVIEPYFMQEDVYVEPFFGAGGMFFSKKSHSKFNILNDYDSEVFNLFMVFTTRFEEFKALFELAPIDANLFQYWKEVGKDKGAVERAVAFVFLSNYSFRGGGATIRVGSVSPKTITLGHIDWTKEFLSRIDHQFLSYDFRDFFGKFEARSLERSFIYADPPYLDTADNYESSFCEADTRDLFDTLLATDRPFCISEFNHPKVLEMADERNLYVVDIGKRWAIAAERTEVLIMNYKKSTSIFFN